MDKTPEGCALAFHVGLDQSSKSERELVSKPANDCIAFTVDQDRLKLSTTIIYLIFTATNLADDMWQKRKQKNESFVQVYAASECQSQVIWGE